MLIFMFLSQIDKWKQTCNLCLAKLQFQTERRIRGLEVRGSNPGSGYNFFLKSEIVIFMVQYNFIDNFKILK